MKNNSRINRIFFFAVLFVFSICFADAQIKLPAIIGTNMVLQKDINIPIWGWSVPGNIITVKFLEQNFTTTANTDGKWFLKLAIYKAGGPYTMEIFDNSGQKIVLENILVGDVWLASGQSNMEFGIKTDSRGDSTIQNANDSLIHFFYVPMAKSLTPLTETGKPASNLDGKWLVCSPAILPNFAWHGFSAIGYYFAQQIRLHYKVPVGIIGSYKGGTPAQAWTSLQALGEDSTFNHYMKRHETLVANYSQALSELEKQKKESVPAQKQIQPDGGFGAPANLFNAMIHPLIPYAIKGVIWYQGESNGDKINDAIEYKKLFPALIKDWRTNWKQGDFPFLFVQLANFRKQAQTPSEGIWPWVREAQSQTLKVSHTGMAVISDIGDANDIHPKDKYDVAQRLFVAAQKVAYGKKIGACNGPLYQSYQIKNNKIIIRFSNAGNKLTTGNSPLMQRLQNNESNKELRGFAIAGADKKFVWAKAYITKNKVIVFSEDVKNPVAVRYNWADNPFGNLYNTNLLPASSFRTDDWQPENLY